MRHSVSCLQIKNISLENESAALPCPIRVTLVFQDMISEVLTKKHETGESVSARDNFFIYNQTVGAVSRQVDLPQVERLFWRERNHPPTNGRINEKVMCMFE